MKQKMANKILRSILVVAATVLLSGMAIIMWCLYDYFMGIQQVQLRDELNLAAAATEQNGIEYLEQLAYGNYRITWVAADGSVIFDSQVEEADMDNHSDREEIQEAISGGAGHSYRRSDTLMQQTLYEAKSLSDGTVLRISVSRATAARLALDVMPPLLVVTVMSIVFSALVAQRMAQRIVEPLNSLDLDNPLDNDAYEELSPLLNRISRQRGQIAEQLHELKRQRDEFEQITDNMNEGLVLLDNRGHTVSINPAAKALFRTDGSCIGKDFLAVERGHELRHGMEAALREGRSAIRAERAGREYQFDFSRIESDGVAVGIVLLAFDISEQAFAERNRREFTANVSHELKTPLQAIIGGAELLERGLVKEEDAPRFMGHIRKEATRLVTLIEDIIRLSQLDEGQSLPQESVDLYALAREAAASLSPAAAQKSVAISVQGGSAIIQGARRMLYEIVYNLCDNAVKYGREGGSVEVTVTDAGAEAVLTVKDDGIGIPIEHQQRIFERFYRVDKSHSRQSGGTGLGLSIVKHAVQYYRGRIELHSEVDKGTVITVAIPKACNLAEQKGLY